MYLHWQCFGNYKLGDIMVNIDRLHALPKVSMWMMLEMVFIYRGNSMGMTY